MTLTPRGQSLADTVRGTARVLFWTAVGVGAVLLAAVVLPTIANHLAAAITGS